MRKILVSIIAFFPFYSMAQVQQPPAFPDGSEAFFNKAMKAINTRHVTWVKSTAKKTNENNWTEAEVRKESNSYAVLGNINNADIEALAFLVLMQAARSAQEDLKAIMAKVKAINHAKSKQRELLQEAQKKSSSYSSKRYDSLKHANDRIQALSKGQNPDAVKFVTTRMAPTNADMDGLVGQIKNDLDSISEMSEMESLRLQMAMDRLSKMMSTLANILKKIRGTQDAIIDNLK